MSSWGRTSAQWEVHAGTSYGREAWASFQEPLSIRSNSATGAKHGELMRPLVTALLSSLETTNPLCQLVIKLHFSRLSFLDKIFLGQQVVIIDKNKTVQDFFEPRERKHQQQFGRLWNQDRETFLWVCGVCWLTSNLVGIQVQVLEETLGDKKTGGGSRCPQDIHPLPKELPGLRLDHVWSAHRTGPCCPVGLQQMRGDPLSRRCGLEPADQGL